MTGVLVQSQLPLPLLRSGKVREVYEVDDSTLLLVASDRVSATNRESAGSSRHHSATQRNVSGACSSASQAAPIPQPSDVAIARTPRS